MNLSSMFAIAAACISCASPAKAAEPFDFRGIKLGITIDELRTTPHPDGELQASAVVVCSYDQPSHYAVAVTEEEAAIGVRTCAYFLPGQGVLSLLEPAPIKVGGRETTKKITFSFIEDPQDHSSRLFRIMVPVGIDAEGDVEDALIGRFGPPVSAEENTAHTLMGAAIPRKTLSWTNQESSILLQAPFARVDDMMVLYLDSRLSKYKDELMQQAKGPPEGRM